MQMRREYDHESWLFFLDLEKSFDELNHNLLFKLLAQFRIPSNVVNVIKTLYTDFKMTLRIGKEKTKLITVKQGDVLAPTLFLFPMQAMADSVMDRWKEENIEQFNYLNDYSDQMQSTPSINNVCTPPRPTTICR